MTGTAMAVINIIFFLSAVRTVSTHKTHPNMTDKWLTGM